MALAMRPAETKSGSCSARRSFVGRRHRRLARHLHDASAWHATNRQVIHGDRVATAARAESTDRQRSLRQRDDRTIGTTQRRRQQRATLQTARIADRRGHDVEPRARLCIRADLRRSP